MYAFGLCEAVHISPPSSAREPTRKYEHLGAHLADVEDVRALDDHAGAVARGELGRRQPHVAPEPEPKLARAACR